MVRGFRQGPGTFSKRFDIDLAPHIHEAPKMVGIGYGQGFGREMAYNVLESEHGPCAFAQREEQDRQMTTLRSIVPLPSLARHQSRRMPELLRAEARFREGRLNDS